MDKEDDVESEYLACHDDDDAPMIEQGSESPMDLDMIEREKQLRPTDDMGGAGHAVTPSKGWFTRLRQSQGHRFTEIMTLNEVAHDNQCDSNLLGAYYLAK
ncbi:hypothetical protein L916_13835 [Phytophthora nicotianae]|uniref:Uncharacterized protein n=1 Tax=Phytophthora nicotianae TaxID=4792 RepID=W2II09_PHYNI|nr:hypothetical protein L916_13835 [Phytophthora nicotianae]